MALTLRRWVAGTVLACGAIAVAKLPPPVERQLPQGAARLEDFETPMDRVQLLRIALRQSRMALSRAEEVIVVRDAARTATVGADGGPMIVLPPQLPAQTRRAIESRVAVLWHELGGTSPDGTTRIVVVVNRVPLQILPAATDGHTCIVQLPIGWSLRWMLRSPQPPPAAQLDGWLRQGLGPCAYYAAFGRPGPAIETWLEQRRFNLATDLRWTAPATLDRGDSTLATRQLARAVTFWQLDERYAGSLDAVACHAGDLARCRSALFPTARPGMPGRQDPPGVITRWWWDRNTLWDGQRYFADLVRTMGRDRFQQFWRSPAPVDSAFRTAMGMPIEVWTARWQRERMEGLVVGSRVRPLWVLLALVLASLCVAGSAYFAERRQIG